MFHYFHGQGHSASQGSIDAPTFVELVEGLGVERFLDAADFLERARSSRLRGHELCVTFDDGLASQRDVALPALEHLGLTAFWFVNTSMFSGPPPTLELYRAFRTEAYDNVERFYCDFEDELNRSLPARASRARVGYETSGYLREYSYYGDRDRWFRFLRDLVLTREEYEQLMSALMDRAEFDQAGAMDQLWLRADDLKHLSARGHVIGLHSHSHPLRIDRLAPDEQRTEYEQNYEIVGGILGDPPRSASHPGGWYSSKTLAILQGLGIEIAFRADRRRPPAPLELPREDAALLGTLSLD